jgi:photosystem II stability/assembly factor-like uncharacterized protein
VKRRSLATKGSAAFSLYAFALLFLFFAACRKRSMVASLQQIKVGLGLPVNDVHFFNDSLGICVGGDFWTKAQIFSTTNGGLTWSDRTPAGNYQAALHIHAVNGKQVYIGGNAGYWWLTDSTCSSFIAHQHPSWLAVKDFAINAGNTYLLCSSPAATQLSTINAAGQMVHTAYMALPSSRMLYSSNALSIAASSSVVRATLLGDSTNPQLTPPNQDIFTDIARSRQQAVLCGYNGSLYYSQDSCTSWQMVKAQNSIAATHRYRAAVCDDIAAYFVGDKGVLSKLTFATEGIEHFSLGNNVNCTGVCYKGSGQLSVSTEQGLVLLLLKP